MKNKMQIQWLFLVFILLLSCKGQNHIKLNKKNNLELTINNKLNVAQIDTLIVNNAPNNITRTMVQDKIGNIWFATFGDILKYDGYSFTNITKEVSSSRFFSVLEDSKGNLWFGSIGSGVYHYDGESFQNFTVNDGLINNEVVCIYEDKKGNIWFGANGGASMYNGKSFQNYKITENSMIKDSTRSHIPNFQRPINEVNSIIEDKSGKFWFGTRGNTFIYNGKSFIPITQNEKPFTNVRWLIEDRRGYIWLGGNDGLWTYDGTTFNNITKKFVGYIYEDKKGNVWTSSEKNTSNWVLSRYDKSFLENGKKIVNEIKTEKGMFFGILEDSEGNIWTGTLNGIHQYNGIKFNYFKGEIAK